MEALKNKDTVKNGVCSLLISAIALKEKEGHAKLSDDEAMSYVPVSYTHLHIDNHCIFNLFRQFL